MIKNLKTVITSCFVVFNSFVAYDKKFQIVISNCFILLNNFVALDKELLNCLPSSKKDNYC